MAQNLTRVRSDLDLAALKISGQELDSLTITRAMTLCTP